MGKLSHIRAQLEKPPTYQIEGLLESIAESVAAKVGDGINATLVEQAQGLNALQNAVGELDRDVIETIVERLKPSIRDYVGSLKPLFQDLAQAIERTRSEQGRIVSALSRVQIPDYSAALDRLERKQVDLSPVLDKLDNLEIEQPETEDDPRRWVFHVERDANGFITNVTAEAE